MEADGQASTANVVLEVDTNSETKAVGIQLIVEDVDDMVEKDIDNLVITSDLGTVTLEVSLPFVDVDADDWFYDSVQFAYQNDLMAGTSDTTFEPHLGTTRGMIVTILHRLDGMPEASVANKFDDVADGEYYSDAVAWGNEHGIILGYNSENFGPNDTITREQLAAILYRYADFKAMDVTTGENTNILSYDDSLDISAYAASALQWAIAEGLITGRSESILAPTAGATRAEVSTVLMHFDALTK